MTCILVEDDKVGYNDSLKYMVKVSFHIIDDNAAISMPYLFL